MIYVTPASVRICNGTFFQEKAGTALSLTNMKSKEIYNDKKYDDSHEANHSGDALDSSRDGLWEERESEKGKLLDVA